MRAPEGVPAGVDLCSSVMTPGHRPDTDHGGRWAVDQAPPFYRALPREVLARSPQQRSPMRRRSGLKPVLSVLLATLIFAGPIAGFVGYNLTEEAIRSAIRDYYRAYDARDKRAAADITCDTQNYKVTGWGPYRDDPVYDWFNPPTSVEDTDVDGGDADPYSVGIDEDVLRNNVELDIVSTSAPSIRSTTIGPIGHSTSVVTTGDSSTPLAVKVLSEGGRWKVCDIEPRE